MTTVRDVARRAGVSPATVSRAMNTSVPVSPELRARVMKAAQELGYRPNSSAQSLRRGKSRTVALLVGDICDALGLSRTVNEVVDGNLCQRPAERNELIAYLEAL